MVNDLQLISSMCSACGNALHVVTAWKNRLVMDGGLAGGFFVFDPDGEESTASVCFWPGGGGRELRAVSVVL